MAAAKIKKGDNVVVRSGKDKGRTGTVLQVMPKDGKVLVAGRLPKVEEIRAWLGA